MASLKSIFGKRRGQSQSWYKYLFDSMQFGVVLLDVLFDADHQPFEFRFAEVNRAFFIGLDQPAEAIVGKTVHQVLPQMANFWIEKLVQAYHVGGPFEVIEHYPQKDTHIKSTINRPDLEHLVVIISDVTHQVKRQKEIDTVLAVSSALRTSQSLSEMLPVLLAQIYDLFSADGVAIGLKEPVSGELVFLIGAGLGNRLVGVRRKLNQGISGRVMATGEPYVINDVKDDPYILPVSELPPCTGLAAIPLMADNQPNGLFMIERINDFSDFDVHLMQAIADIAGNAIQRTTLHEETIQRLQRVDTLHRIDKILTNSLDIHSALNQVLEMITASLNVHAIDILLYDESSHTLTYEAGHGFHADNLYHTVMRIGKGFASQVVTNRKVIQIADIRQKSRQPSNPHWLEEEGFIGYCGIPLIAKEHINGVLELYQRQVFNPNQEWVAYIETIANEISVALDNTYLLNNLQNSNQELIQAYDTTLEGWARALELRDKETEGHSQNVSYLAVELAILMGVPEDQITHLRRGALLHDLGKMGIPDQILLKPGPLNQAEWEIMHRHTTYAFNLLSPIAFLNPALEIPYCHHERWDGNGYPRGLEGEEIPLAARIFSIVDVWDALRSDRPYRPAWTERQALAYIRDQDGKHFDPQVVGAFFNLLASRGIAVD